jgi:hypothetical protein
MHVNALRASVLGLAVHAKRTVGLPMDIDVLGAELNVREERQLNLQFAVQSLAEQGYLIVQTRTTPGTLLATECILDVTLTGEAYWDQIALSAALSSLVSDSGVRRRSASSLDASDVVRTFQNALPRMRREFSDTISRLNVDLTTEEYLRDLKRECEVELRARIYRAKNIGIDFVEAGLNATADEAREALEECVSKERSRIYSLRSARVRRYST